MDTMRVAVEVGTTLYRWATAHPVEAAGVLWAAQSLARRIRWSPRHLMGIMRTLFARGEMDPPFAAALALPVALVLDAALLPVAFLRGFHRRAAGDVTAGVERDVVEIVQNVLSATKAEIHDRITRVEQREAERRVKMGESLEEILARKVNERIDARMGQERAHFTTWCAAEIERAKDAKADPMRPLFGDTPRLSLVTIERPEDAAESKRLGMALLALFGATDGKRPDGLAFDLHLDKSGEVKGVVEISDEVAAIRHGTAYAMADAVAKALGREPSAAILIDTKTGARIELR